MGLKLEIKKKKVKKFLNKKISQLNDIVADLDGLVTKIGEDFYRVSIFGSARIQPDSPEYKSVYDLAYELSKRGADIVTGGGPGLMEAANRGAKAGSSQSRSFGLSIQLPFEGDANSHLDVKYEHQRFSSRLDEFMRMSHAVVITPGGIGTLLELFYTWQLLQVKHIEKRPVILVGSMWKGLLDWVTEGPLAASLLDKKDLDNLKLVANVSEVVGELEPAMKAFYQNNSDQSN